MLSGELSILRDYYGAKMEDYYKMGNYYMEMGDYE
jgi:hypothetical protein